MAPGLVAAGAAHAQDRAAVFAGGYAGGDRSAYVGVVAPLPGATLGHGLAVRVTAFAGSYDYASGARRIDADFAGGEALAAYQFSGSWGYANLAAGPRFTRTNLSSHDPGSKREGSRWDAGVAADGARNMGPWRMGGFASYGFDLEEYYVRADVTRQAGSTFRLGVEVGAQGDPDYDRQLVGAVVAAKIAPEWEVRGSAGAVYENGGQRGYVSIGFTRVF